MRCRALTVLLVSVAASSALCFGDVCFDEVNLLFEESGVPSQDCCGPIVTGDLDGDGDPDVVTAGSTITVRFNDGAGGLPALTVLTPPNPTTIVNLALADLDGDGALDVVACGTGVGGMAYYRNLGGGDFAPAVSLALLAFSVVSGDLDGDGSADLVFNDAVGGIQVILNDGGGNFGPAVELPVSGPDDHALADFDRDGDLDVVVASDGLLSYFENPGTGVFGAPVAIPYLGSGAAYLRCGDVDEDGRTDVLVATQTGPYLFTNTQGPFDAPVSFDAFGFSPFELCDLDGDGTLDLLSVVQAFDPLLGVRLGAGDGTFGGASTIEPVALGFSGSRAVCADLDGDGGTDFVVSLIGVVGVYLGRGLCAPVEFLRGDANGNGAFEGIADSLVILGFQFQGGPAPACLEAADVDGDGVFAGLVDGLYALSHAFAGGPPPGAPYPDCGEDPDPGAGLACVAGCP